MNMSPAEPLDDIEIKDRVYDANYDLYVVFGIAHSAKIRPYVVAWQSRENPNLVEIEQYEKEDLAQSCFNKAACGEIRPTKPNFTKDHHRLSVYKWENIYIEPYSREMNEIDIAALIHKASKAYNIPIPSFEIDSDAELSTYSDEDHHIILRDADTMTTLHEMAHAIHAQGDHYENADIAHAPQFTWILIDLYHRYMDISIQHLVISAVQSNLLGDLSAKQMLALGVKDPDDSVFSLGQDERYNDLP